MNLNEGTNDSTEETIIRIGPVYQAEIPSFIPVNERKSEYLNQQSTLLWSPVFNITDEECEKYILFAKTKLGYLEPQSLGLLLTHNHHLENAYKDLGNYSRYIVEWTDEEKRIFQNGILEHKKNFYAIQTNLPQKSTSDVVEYYYNIWKKKRRNFKLSKRLQQ